jgi:hypothetical protein
MSFINRDQLELKVHGLTEADHGRVAGRVFADKLKQVVQALEEADRLANGKIVHEYVLASMHMSEPTAVLAERLVSARGGISAIPIFNEAFEAIKANDRRVLDLAPVIKRVQSLTVGVNKKFGFAEIRTSENVFRIDDFLKRRAVDARRKSVGVWFDGIAYGSFDGVLRFVDLRGSLPEIKLTLTAGGKEIDCVCRREDIDSLGEVLDRRVRVSGRAIYTSSSPLPMRVEVQSIEPVVRKNDFSKWLGSFEPFDQSDWDVET